MFPPYRRVKQRRDDMGGAQTLLRREIFKEGARIYFWSGFTGWKCSRLMAYCIRSTPFHFLAMPTSSREIDPLEPAALASRLQGTIFSEQKNIRYFRAIGSTNTAAMQAAVQGASEGSLFIAEEQLAGRGRGGHSWHSEARSGIYLSVILRPKVEPSAALALSLIAGVAVHDAIMDVCKVAPDL